METNPEPIKEILEELFSLLESLETQSLALTQFLKDQGIATDERLAPYLDRAGNASSVKWRAARARMQYLLSPIAKGTSDKEKDKNKDQNKDPEKSSTEKPQTEKPPTEKSTEQNKPESSDAAKGTARNTAANANPDKKRQPVTEDNAKKSDTPQKSNRE
jgi:chemotaxis protein histidine kinase CheA